MKKKGWIQVIAAVAVWLGIWQILSVRINRTVFLPSLLEVGKALVQIGITEEFYLSIRNSLLHVLSGFLLAVTMGSLLAVFSYWNKWLFAFIQVPIKLIQATPVASFTMLALVWISSKYLSILVSFLMVLPTITIYIRQGLLETDSKLLEMALVYRMSFMQKIRYIYLPALLPYFLSACSVGVGMSWKSGIAAEVIGVARHSIGNQLYQAKLYLMTPELFAWTFVIIAVSITVEYSMMWAINRCRRRIEGRTKR